MRMRGIPSGLVRCLGAILLLMWSVPLAEAEQQGRQGFHIVAMDREGVETDVRQAVFYYEEKLSETSFIPHELNGLPVKRGAATLHVKFETIKEIEFKAGEDQETPMAVIKLSNGKTGEFRLAIMGSFKGESEFGEVLISAAGLQKVVFK